MILGLLVAFPALAGSLHGAKELINGVPLRGVSTAVVVAAEHRVDVATVDFGGRTFTLRCKAPSKVADCTLKGPDGKRVSQSVSLGGEDGYLRVEGTAKPAYAGESWTDADGIFRFRVPTTGLVDTDFVFGVINGEIH